MLLLVALWLLAIGTLSAASLNYNPGSANWDTSTVNWLNGITPGVWGNTAADTANFTGTGIGVTIQAGGVTAGNLNFQTTGYSISGGALTLAGSASSSITVGSGAAATISAAVLNGFTKVGTGTLTLANAASTNTGNIVVGAGILKLGAANQIADTASMTVLSGATFDLNGFGDTFVLGNDVTATGTITNSSATGATLTVGSSGTAGNFYGNFTGNLTFTDSNAANIAFTGTTASTNTGNATFNAATANTITFNKTSGANVFGGSVLITRGTVVLQQSEQISNTGTVTIDLGNAAQLNLNDQSETIGGLVSANSGTGTAVSLGSGTLTFGLNNSSSTFNGVIIGTGSLVKMGSATATLGATNTFSGGLTINAGAIAVATDASLGAASGGITINGATFQTTASFTTGRAITFGASGGTLNLDPSTTLTLNSSASISGTSAMGKSGLGTFALQATSGNPLGTGQFTLTTGAIQFAPSGSGADIALSSVNTATSTRFFFSQGNTLALNKGSNTSLALTLGNVGATAPGSAANGVLARSGQGTLVIAPTVPGNLGSTEKLLINGGVFQVNSIINPTVVAQDSNAQKPADFLTYSGTNGLQVATYTDNNFTSPTAASIENITANTILLANQQVYALRIGDGTAALALDITGITLTLGNGVSTNAAGLILNPGASGSAVSITGGTLALGNSEGVIYAGAGAAGSTVSSVITGLRGLTLFGFGTLTLSGASTYSGTTTVNSGTLRLGASNALPSATTLNLQPNPSTGFDLNNFNQTITILNGSGNVALGSGTLTVGDATNTSFSGIISGTGSLVKVGTGTLTLQASSSTYTGGTTISVGSIKESGSNRLPTTGALTIASGANLDLSGNNSQTVTALTGLGSVINTGSVTSTPVLTIGSTTDFTTDTTLGTGVTNIFNFAKAGTGTATLTATNTYTGSTQVSGGTLKVGGTTAIPTTTVLTVGATGGSASGTFDLNGYTVSVAGLAAGTTTGTKNINSTAAGAVFIVANSVASTYSGQIQDGAGNVALTKQNAGTLTLSGANTYTGATTIASGILSVATIGNGGIVSSNLGSASNAAVNVVFDGGTLQYTGATAGTDRSFTISAGKNATLDISTSATNWTVAGSFTTTTGSLTKIGAGTLTLSGANAYTGGTTLTAGTLALGSSAAIGSSGTITLGGGTVQFSASNATDYSSRFSTAVSQIYKFDTNNQPMTLATALTSSGGTLTKLGTGTLTLTGNNTYTGLTDVQAGTLSLGRSGGTVANAAAVQVSGGTLDVANSDTVGAVTVSSGIISGAGTLTGSSFNLTNSGNLTANLAGTGGYTKSGAGTATLSGANANTGATTINAGILSIGSIGNGGVASSNLGSAAALAANLVLNGGTLQYSGAGESSNRNFTLGTNGGTFDASGSGAITFSGTPTLSGTNAARTLTLTGTSVLNNSQGGALADNGTGLTALTKSGTGTWVLSGANTFTGITTITGGTLSVSTIGNGGATIGNLGSATSVATNLVLNGGTLQYTGSGEMTDRNFTIGTSGGALDASGSAAITFSGAPTLSGTNTARTLTLSGSNANSNTLGGVLSNNGTGLTALTKSGAGLWTLSGANTFTGITTINGGTLSVGSIGNGGVVSCNLGSATNVAANLVLNGGTLQYTGGGESSDRNFTVGASGGTVDASGSGAITFSGAPTFTPINATHLLSFAGSNVNGNTFSSAIGDSGTGATSVTKTGAGAWLLSGSSGYTGVTTISSGALNASTLANIGSNSSIGRGLSTSNATNAASLVFDGGILKFTGGATTSSRLFTLTQNGGTLDASGSANAALNLNTAGSVAFSGSGTRLLVLTGSSNGANTLAAILGDGFGGATFLTKSGAGTWVLSGANTYTGNTTLDAGTLTIASTGSVANSAVLTIGSTGSSGTVLDVTAKASFAIASGQTLKGIGTVNLGAGKTVTINGRLAPGNSIGTDAVTGNLTLAGTADFELGSPGTRVSPGLSDRTNVSGTLTLGGTLNMIDNSGANGNGSAGAGSYLIFTQSGTGSGGFGSITNLVGYRAKIDTATSGSVFLDNYQLASVAATQTVNVGNTHAGTSKTSALTLSNISPINANYTETLSSDAFGSTTSGFATGGSVSGLSGGSSGSGTLFVGLGTSLAAGNQSGTATLALNSNAVNGSGLSSTSAGFQVITILGVVYDYANPTINTVGPVSFGNIHITTGVATASVSLTNATVSNAAFQDSLNASAATNIGSITGSNFTALAAGGSINLVLTADLSTVGPLASTVTLGYVSNGNGVSGLTDTVLASGFISTSGYVYSGLGVWNTNTSGNWVDTTKWTANGGSPGLDGGFTNTDTATFGNAATLSNPVVSLNGVSPNLKSLTFDNSTRNYTIAQGSGGGITLNNGSGAAVVTVTNGQHTMAVPVLLSSNTMVEVEHSSDGLTISSAISGTKALEKTGAGTLTLSAANNFIGNTRISSGALIAGHNSAFGTGTLILNGGALASDNDSRLIANAIIANSGTSFISGSNSLTLSGGASGGGRVDVNFADSTKSVQVNSAAGGFAPGSVNLTSGTLLLGNPDAIGHGTDLNLNGGTFSMQGLGNHSTAQMGAMTLSASSFLDFGTENGNTLTFSSLFLGGYSLTVNHWSGSFYLRGSTTDPNADSTQDRLLLSDSSGFTPGQEIAAISFFNDSGNFIGHGMEVSFGAQFEIVPVPEPTTILASLALVGWIAWRERRRFSWLVRQAGPPRLQKAVAREA